MPSADHSDSGPWASDEGESDSSPPPPPLSSVTSPSVVSVCLGQLSLLLTQPPSPLSSLLAEKNVEGHTPFMAAVTYKVESLPSPLLLSCGHNNYGSPGLSGGNATAGSSPLLLQRRPEQTTGCSVS